MAPADYARSTSAQKRGGSKPHVSLDRLQLGAREQREFLLALDQALESMSQLDERLTAVFECRTSVE